MRVFIFGSSIAYCHFNFHDQAKESILPVKFSKASKASAFAISESGLALTASHSLKDYEASTLDGEYIQVLDYDSENDLALVQFPRHKR